MASSDGSSANPDLRKGVFGYKRSDVERLVVEHEETLRGLRKEIDTLWIAFAEHDKAVRESLEASGAPAPRVAPWAQRRERAAERMARASEIRTGISSPAERDRSNSQDDSEGEDGGREPSDQGRAASAPSPDPQTANGTTASTPNPAPPEAQQANPPSQAEQPAQPQPEAGQKRPQRPRSPQEAATRPPLGGAAQGEPRPGTNPLANLKQNAQQSAPDSGPSQEELIAAAQEATEKRAALTADLADLEAAMKAIETATKALERNAQNNPSE